MKRTTITRRNVNGTELATVDGWRAEIRGVPVVLCWDFVLPHRRWICCEPRTGLAVSGRVAPTRTGILEVTRQQVEALAKSKGKSPVDFMNGLVDQFRPRRADEG